MTHREIVSKLRALELPEGEFLVIGGASLALRGIRDTNDLDILVTPRLFWALLSRYSLDAQYEKHWNRKRIKIENIEIYPDIYLEKANVFFSFQELYREADFIETIPLQSLDKLLICKLDTGREKDLQDVIRIRDWR